MAHNDASDHDRRSGRLSPSFNVPLPPRRSRQAFIRQLNGVKIGLLTKCNDLTGQLTALSQNHWFSLIQADTAELILRIVESEPIDLVLLHWPKHEREALDCCAALRTKSASITLPVIILSEWAQPYAAARIIDTGADDCLFAPWLDHDLTFRIAKTLGQPKPFKVGALLAYQDIVLDVDCWRVFKGGKEVTLRSAEFKLLRTLMENPHQLLSKERLVREVCDDPAKVDPRSVSVYVARLRKALAKVGPGDPIRTVLGKGYVLDADS